MGLVECERKSLWHYANSVILSPFINNIIATLILYAPHVYQQISFTHYATTVMQFLIIIICAQLSGIL